MKRMINIKKAENRLLELVLEVLEGGEVILSKAGKPVARIIKYEEPVTKPRKLNLGAAKGRFPEFTDEEWRQLDEEIRAEYRQDAKWPDEL